MDYTVPPATVPNADLIIEGRRYRETHRKVMHDEVGVAREVHVTLELIEES